jgi:hypothetical protein
VVEIIVAVTEVAMLVLTVMDIKNHLNINNIMNNNNKFVQLQQINNNNN